MSRRTALLAQDTQIIDTSRGPVETHICGEGPNVVILHGALGGYDRARVYSFPEAGFRFICPSRPGYLRTPLTAGTSIEDQADLTAALLDALGIERAAVIGCSAGGPPAVHFAVRYPERCWALVLGNAISSPLSRTHGLITPVAQAFFGLDWFTWLGVNRPVLYLLQPNLMAQTVTDPAKQAHIQQMLHSIHPTSVRKAGFLNDMRWIQSTRHYPLEQVEAPTLVIHGNADIIVPYHQGLESARRIPQARFLKVEGGTHLCFISHREQVVPALVEFLQESAPQAG
jgi:pimeloyl-ACP methyl ester carboxylesterase